MKLTTIIFLRIILLGCIIPLIMSIIVYQGFSTNYTIKTFSEQSFRSQYEHDIYKYRVTGSYVLLKTFHFIQQHSLPTITVRSLQLLDEHGDPQFYSAYFYVNTFFLCLTCITLLFILDVTNKNMGFAAIEIPILFLCFLMTITQYTVVPYDTLSYFFLSLAVLLIIQRNQSWPAILVLITVIILATLTRETAILILAFYFALNYRLILRMPRSIRLNSQQKTFILISLCFLLTYIGLRVVLGYEHAVFQTVMTTCNDLFSDAGLLLLVSVTLLTIIIRPVTREIIAFFLASLAYILPVLVAGNPAEMRLWTPLILMFTIMKVRATPMTMNEI
jgi:hypothetical protein